MLDRLLNFGMNHGFTINNKKEVFFQFKKLGELDKSCCPSSQLEVIDFDRTKDILSKKKRETQPKSSDALKVLPSSNQIDFIELKGFENFFNHHHKDGSNTEMTIEDQVDKFNIPKKIKDSIFVFEAVIRDQGFNATPREWHEYEDVNKNYIVVTDIDIQQSPLEARLVLYQNLQNHSSEKIQTIKDEINKKLDESKRINNLNRTLILSCSDIDRHYANMQSNS